MFGPQQEYIIKAIILLPLWAALRLFTYIHKRLRYSHAQGEALITCL